MIVLDDTFQKLKKDTNLAPPELLAETLSTAGVAILLTSSTSIAAFMVGGEAERRQRA
jgi:hypothetical protein